MNAALEYLRKEFWWIRIPFTYGHIHKRIREGERSDSNDDEQDEVVTVESVRFDGFIAAIQTFLLIIAITWTMTFASFLSPHFNRSIAHFILSAFMIAGLVVMAAFNKYRKKVLSLAISKTHDSSRDNLMLVGTTIFYVLGCLMDIFYIIASVECNDSWKLCKDRGIYVSYLSKVIFRIVRIVYLGGETLFCITFNRSTFANKPSIRYSLMFLQAANFSLWFEALISEVYHSSEFGRIRHEMFHERCFANTSIESTFELGCIYKNSTIYLWLDDFFIPTFLPFTVEFTLLAGECLVHWYYHCTTCSSLMSSSRSVADRNGDITVFRVTSARENSDAGGQPPSQDDLPNGLERVPESSSRIISAKENSDRGSQLISQEALPNGFELEAGSESEEVNPAVESINGNPLEKWNFLSFFFLCITVGLNGGLCFLAIRLMYVRDDDNMTHVNTYLHYFCGFSVCKTAIVSAGYHFSTKFKFAMDDFTVLDCLLLFTSLGPLAVSMLKLISVGGLVATQANANALTANQTTSFSPAFLVIFELLNTAEVYFQVGFCLYASRIVIEFEDTSDRATLFKGSMLFLVVANAVLWLVGYIVGLDSEPLASLVLRNYFGDMGLKFIKHISTFFPLALFHRLICCLQFSKVYLRLRS